MPGIGTKPKKGSIKKKKLPEYLGSRKPGSSLSTYLGSRKPGGSSTTPATKPQQPASIKDTKHPGRKGAWRGGQKEGKKESKGQKDIYNKNKAPKSTTTAKEAHAKWKGEHTPKVIYKEGEIYVPLPKNDTVYNYKGKGWIPPSKEKYTSISSRRPKYTGGGGMWGRQGGWKKKKRPSK